MSKFNNIASVVSAIVGTFSITLALSTLLPEGNWIALMMLVVGTQAIMMSFRHATLDKP